MFRFYKLSAEKQKQNIVENNVAFAFLIFLFFCIFLLYVTCSSSISKCVFDDFYFVFPHLNIELGFQGGKWKGACGRAVG